MTKSEKKSTPAAGSRARFTPSLGFRDGNRPGGYAAARPLAGVDFWEIKTVMYNPYMLLAGIGTGVPVAYLTSKTLLQQTIGAPALLANLVTATAGTMIAIGARGTFMAGLGGTMAFPLIAEVADWFFSQIGLTSAPPAAAPAPAVPPRAAGVQIGNVIRGGFSQSVRLNNLNVNKHPLSMRKNMVVPA